jgi:hypothetical protein
MANRTKKDASDALSQLRKYLHRDPHACQLLEAMSRYQGQLRQDCAQLKTETTTLGDARGVTLLRNVTLTTKNQTLRLALDKEQAITNQLKGDLAQMQVRIKQLEKELEPADLETSDKIPDDLRTDVAAVKKLTKALQRRMKVAPKMRLFQPSEDKRHSLIDVRSIVTDYSGDQYTTLGMFVTLSTMIGMPVSFEWKAPGRKGIGSILVAPDSDSRDEALMHKQIHWLRRWIYRPEWQTQLIEASEPVEPGGRGDYRQNPRVP